MSLRSSRSKRFGVPAQSLCARGTGTFPEAQLPNVAPELLAVAADPGAAVWNVHVEIIGKVRHSGPDARRQLHPKLCEMRVHRHG